MLASKSESTWLGEQVRNLRKLRGLSLEALADSIDRSVGFVSQLERGKSEPTITDLINLSVALSVPEHIFFSPSTPADRGVVVRANQRPMLRYAGGITDFLLSPNLAGNFQMQMTLMDPDSESSHELIQSGCIEAAYVLEGPGAASSTAYSYQLPPGAFYSTTEWRGAVSAAWASANGAARVTEFTA